MLHIAFVRHTQNEIYLAVYLLFFLFPPLLWFRVIPFPFFPKHKLPSLYCHHKPSGAHNTTMDYKQRAVAFIAARVEYHIVVLKYRRKSNNNEQMGRCWKRDFYELFRTFIPSGMVGRPGLEREQSGLTVLL